ncbi:MAG: AbrB/MazE/SpoVT family DNA-binding domain-containing protein [Tunicatimonas sp.]
MAKKFMVSSLDKFGRIIIPKKVRKQLGITSETILTIEEDGSRIIIEPIQPEGSIVKKDEVLVFVGKPEGEVDQLLTIDRTQRMDKLQSGQ